MDGPTEVAAAGSIRETSRDAVEASAWHPELLSDQGSVRSGRGRQWEHSYADQPRPRLSESPLYAPEGRANGSDQRRIHRCSRDQESCLKMDLRRILAQSPNFVYFTGG